MKRKITPQKFLKFFLPWVIMFFALAGLYEFSAKSYQPFSGSSALSVSFDRTAEPSDADTILKIVGNNPPYRLQDNVLDVQLSEQLTAEKSVEIKALSGVVNTSEYKIKSYNPAGVDLIILPYVLGTAFIMGFLLLVFPWAKILKIGTNDGQDAHLSLLERFQTWAAWFTGNLLIITTATSLAVIATNFTNLRLDRNTLEAYKIFIGVVIFITTAAACNSKWARKVIKVLY